MLININTINLLKPENRPPDKGYSQITLKNSKEKV